MVREHPPGTAPLDIVIPALDAAPHLAATLASLAPGRARGLVREIMVVDGGSADGTRAIAAAAGAQVLASAAGRGRQLRAGGAAAQAPWLLFLHADTRLGAGWAEKVAGFIGTAPARGEAAAVFRLRLDDTAIGARALERMVIWRTRALGLPYGDQGLLISRALYRKVGGFAELPLMEDVDLVRRLGRRRLTLLRGEATTSAERYRKAGYLARSLMNLAILLLYHCGVPPERLARLYGSSPARSRKR
jgi:rSAM/selenodomain-associated transferase 2